MPKFGTEMTQRLQQQAAHFAGNVPAATSARTYGKKEIKAGLKELNFSEGIAPNDAIKTLNAVEASQELLAASNEATATPQNANTLRSDLNTSVTAINAFSQPTAPTPQEGKKPENVEQTEKADFTASQSTRPEGNYRGLSAVYKPETPAP